MHKRLPPLALYIHFPWCIQKCPYCDFNSHTLKETLPQDSYIDALLLNFQQQIPYIQDRPLISIFMGGGTPSLFSANALNRLLTQIRTYCDFSKDIEITLEANPGTVEHNPFAAYREIGINRLSLGIQSFNNHHLKKLGRIHDGDTAFDAIQQAKKAGFDNFNLDLMFGLPDQTLEEGLTDLKMALAQNPSHLSWYELTLEPNTYFYQFPPLLPSQENICELQEQGQLLLSQSGFKQYEVSAYSQDRPSQHNLNYWQFGDYLAIGAGSHAKITTADQAIFRLEHWRHPKQYMDTQQAFLQSQKPIPQNQLAFEYMLNALRLKEGTPTAFFEKRTGLSLDSIRPLLQTAQTKGWLHPFEQTICTTPIGYQFLNDVISLFLAH